MGMASLATPLKIGTEARFGLSTSATLPQDSDTFEKRCLPERQKVADTMEKPLVARA